MEEIKTYHRNLAVAFMTTRGNTDEIRHELRLKMNMWMYISENVTPSLSELMRMWKTILEIWNNGEKKAVDGST